MKFPHYQQFDAADCGPTCLRMISRFYGKVYSAEMLRNHCFITREGVSMLGISDAAEFIGFRTMGVRISFDQLANEALLPCILHWNQNHFVVCYDIKKSRNGKYKIYIADPASQLICYDEKELCDCWVETKKNGKDVGTALLLTPTPEFGKQDEEIEVRGKDISSFMKYLLPHKQLFFQLFLGMVVSSLLQLLFPFLTQAIVDKGINGRDMSVITLILFAQLLLFVCQLMVGYIRNWILLHINSRVDISLVADFLSKLMSMPLHFFDVKNTGDILQRIKDHSRIKGFLMGNSMNILFSCSNFIIFAFVLAHYNIQIFMIFIIGNLMHLCWILLFLKYRRELDIKRFYQAVKEQNNMLQLVQGMQDIKLNNCERAKRWDWERIQVNLFKIGLKGLTLGQIQNCGSVFFTKATDIIVTYIAASSVVNGEMTLGMMMALTYILGQVSAPIYELIGFIQSFQDAKISLERLNEIHAQEDEEHDIEYKLLAIPQKGSIQVDNITYSYSGAERDYALKDVSLTIPEGKVTAIVGESGSGKTTLIKLLQGFYKPNDGTIKVGGVNLDNINPHVWRKSTGSVMQESFIFSDTIAKNIALCTDDVDVERLYESALLANADEFISALPLSYNTRIGMEGCGVSQGQRQRLLIARAIYKNPKYLFFDEATNSLDATNERIIMENLHKIFENRTVVIAAHRLSTVMDADNIVVMKKGKIVEQGTHRELVDLRGHYYTLVKNQLELGQ